MPMNKCSFTIEDAYTQLVLSAIANSKGIILICGAGISVAAGIPDFRSKQEIIGVPELGQRKLKDMFRVSMISDERERPFFARFTACLAQKAEESEPTAFHELLKKLDERESLVRVYTQNIDGLEMKAGLSTYHRAHRDNTLGSSRCIPVHGSLQYLYCLGCRSVEQAKQHWDELKDGTFPACSSCKKMQEVRRAAGKRKLAIPRMIPDIVLYDQEHPDGQRIADFVTEDLSKKQKVDLLLVVGTGMHVVGTRKIIQQFSTLVRKHHREKFPSTIYLNLDFKQQKKWESTFDVWVQADCQVVANAVLNVLKKEDVPDAQSESIRAFVADEAHDVEKPMDALQRNDRVDPQDSNQDLLASCYILVDFHIKHVLDIARGDSELVDAICLLKCAMKMTNCGADLALVEFHLKRIGNLRIGDGELERRLDLVRACIDFMRTKLPVTCAKA